MFVIRKGVREYVMDKPEQRKMLLDRSGVTESASKHALPNLSD